MQGPEQVAGRANVLGCRVDLVDMAQSLRVVSEFIMKGQPRQVITLNAEIIYAARRHAELRQVIEGAGLVTPDGAGVVWAARFLGYPVRERVTGIDLAGALAAEAAVQGWRVFLLGARPGVAAQAADNLVAQYPGLRVVGTQHGYFQEEEMERLLAEIKDSRPDLLLVGLGAPYQEFWIHRYQRELEVPVAVGVGGSLDVLAGRVRRAPGWLIRLNLEWLYRLVLEPRRWRRQLVLPCFVWQVIRQKLGGTVEPMAGNGPPAGGEEE